MSAARTERLLNLLTLLLNSRRPISLRELREMEEFRAYCSLDPKTGERAFERDKASLVELGVPLYWIAPEDGIDEEGVGGYLIDRERYYLPELDLTAAELALLSIAGAAAVAMDGFPGKKAVLRALDKLGFDITEGMPEKSTLLAHTPLRSGGDLSRFQVHLELLYDSVVRRCQLGLVYGGAKEVMERKVDPYGLYYRQGFWYLVGYCHLRQKERTFHVGRIKNVEIIKGPRQGGHYQLPESFNIEEHIRRRPWEYPREPVMEVRMRLAERLVPAIPEIFGGRARIERKAGDIWVYLSVTYTAPLIAAILPFGAAIEVVDPPELRAKIGNIFSALTSRYKEAAP